jgi:hypothetical protein
VTFSHGKTGKDVRRFLRQMGYRPNAAMVERVQREVVRTQSENERVQKTAQESGRGGAYDQKGDVKARVRKIVKRDLDSRKS